MSTWVSLGTCVLLLIATILRIYADRNSGKAKEQAETVASFLEYLAKVCFAMESSGGTAAEKKARALSQAQSFKEANNVPISDELIGMYIDEFVQSANTLREDPKMEKTEVLARLTEIFGAQRAAELLNEVPCQVEIVRKMAAGEPSPENVMITGANTANPSYYEVKVNYGK